MIQRLIVLVALVAVLTAAACGLKGPPVPPDVAKDEEQRPSVVGEQKEDADDESEEARILELYGEGGAPKLSLPRVEESLGTGSLGETGDPPKSWIERQSEWEDALPPYATPTPAPKNDEPQDEENKEDS